MKYTVNSDDSWHEHAPILDEEEAIAEAKRRRDVGVEAAVYKLVEVRRFVPKEA
jgi:hypothetical protein